MEKLKSLITEANGALHKADHLVYITYAQVQETKLLYTIAYNLYVALNKGMEAVLHYERLYKRIPLVKRDFEYELGLFKNRIGEYNINRSCVLLLQDLKRLVETKQKGPIDFIRRDKFVICSEDYSMQVLNLQKVKNYLADVKIFMDRVNRTVRLK
ncbi:MAG: hypothetical protein KKA65_01155 [Nanoarchaeota archaeon]|nr:hypothetical protein [Nanoarchaeota archaeon]MBU4352640.1 hypothetical protein [Nanoarchaeota archaeon]MBU4456087.1 hypothetical protein [Nanoarchaeota archaeon]MCG2719923.1 hypothetical protein [Nanoarchaeota archaeon]